MKLTDKRFWIFEAFTIIYAGLLMLLELIIFGKSLTGEIMLFIIACVVSLELLPGLLQTGNTG